MTFVIKTMRDAASGVACIAQIRDGVNVPFLPSATMTIAPERRFPHCLDFDGAGGELCPTRGEPRLGGGIWRVRSARCHFNDRSDTDRPGTRDGVVERGGCWAGQKSRRARCEHDKGSQGSPAWESFHGRESAMGE
ncbi:MAG TPA: hypothetical protein VMU99_11110 [Acidimicrobiales bacterium]|nr:hypothetical protein [Acidimicrobiales bacterium]